MKKLKVLHIITTLPRLAGAADNTRYTVNLLNVDRYDVHLACGPAELDKSRLAEHVSLIVIEALVRPFAPVSDLRAAWELLHLLRRERYDIVHTHTAKAGALGRLVAKIARVPVTVHTAHSISFAASASPLANHAYRLVDSVAARFCDKIVTVSELNAKKYLNARIGQPGQYVTIYSGVDTAKYLDRSQRVACRAELGIADSDVFVVWIGRMNRQKDPVTYVRAADQLLARFPHLHFAMIGDDPLGESLESEVSEAIQASRLGTKIRMLGYRPDIERILAAADLMIHTSLYEGLGRTVIEGMLAGVPIVATAVDGVPEAVVSGVRGGLLVPPEDPVAVADAASQLIENPQLAARLTATGQAWARERFEVRDMVAAIDRLYQALWLAHAQRAT